MHTETETATISVSNGHHHHHARDYSPPPRGPARPHRPGHSLHGARRHAPGGGAGYTSSVYPHWFGRSVRRTPAKVAHHHATASSKSAHRQRARAHEPPYAAPRSAAAVEAASPTPAPHAGTFLLDGGGDERDETTRETKQRRPSATPDGGRSWKPSPGMSDIDKKLLMAKWEREVFRMKLAELDREMSEGFARWLFPDVGREI